MSLVDKVNFIGAAWRAFDARRGCGEDSGEYRYALRALEFARMRHEMAGAVAEEVASEAAVNGEAVGRGS